MPWSLLLDLRVILAAGLLLASGYAALQRLAKENCRAEFAQYRADAESEAAKAKVRNAQEAAQHAQHAQEALDDLQTRHDAISARYERLRHAQPGGSRLPALSDAAPSLGACRGEPGQPDPLAGRLEEIEERVLAVLAKGDAEIAKLVELYRLDEANAAKR